MSKSDTRAAGGNARLMLALSINVVIAFAFFVAGGALHGPERTLALAALAIPLALVTGWIFCILLGWPRRGLRVAIRILKERERAARAAPADDRRALLSFVGKLESMMVGRVSPADSPSVVADLEYLCTQELLEHLAATEPDRAQTLQAALDRAGFATRPRTYARSGHRHVTADVA